jgi:hypothetical protein
MHGHGVYKYANGDIYEGGWIDSIKEGHGTYCYSKGNIVKGIWKGDKFLH